MKSSFIWKMEHKPTKWTSSCSLFTTD